MQVLGNTSMEHRTGKTMIRAILGCAFILAFTLDFSSMTIGHEERVKLTYSRAISSGKQVGSNTEGRLQKDKSLEAYKIAGLGSIRDSGEDTDAEYSLNDITIYEMTSDYTWCLNGGVKQPLGAYKDGWSIHQISKYTPTPEQARRNPGKGNPARGNPDYIFWVNEKTGSYGISETPTNAFRNAAPNPGGMVSFSEDGTIWYTFGERGGMFSPDVYSSKYPYDVNTFTRVLNDYATNKCTSFCINVHASKAMLCWRNGWSVMPSTTVRFRRYDSSGHFGFPEIEADLGKGAVHDTLGKIGIEQVWTRFDPRFNYIFVMWQWFDVKNLRFGSPPFIYSDDFGSTWKKANGEPYRNLPISYLDIDNIIVPYDHLKKGENATWCLRDMGVSPNGTFWMTIPKGNTAENGAWSMFFWFFDGVRWQYRELTDKMSGWWNSPACGVTNDYLAFVYSEEPGGNILKVRISGDDGRTWSKPAVLDVLANFSKIRWVSFVQPSDKFTDNFARFYYGYYKADRKDKWRRHRNNIKWIKFRIEK